ncbi:MAG: hypothetical protein JW878_06915 [Methanomicrobia archaeon]|nr:hypothetical protein [Methanomicrobia archaeon]
MYTLLKQLGIEAEEKGKQELEGPAKAIKTAFYRVLAPIVFNIQTETECYCYIFQKDGSVTLLTELDDKPDVTLIGPYEEVLYLLQTRDKERFEMAQRTRTIKIDTNTFQGSLAVTKLREMFL